MLFTHYFEFYLPTISNIFMSRISEIDQSLFITHRKQVLAGKIGGFKRSLEEKNALSVIKKDFSAIVLPEKIEHHLFHNISTLTTSLVDNNP